MLLPHPSRFGDELSEGSRLLSAAQQGQQVHRRVQLRSLVHAPVHVDRHAGDHQQIPVNVHQTAHKAVSLPDHHPARHRQGPIQPATPHTAAVRLHAEPQGIAGGSRFCGLPHLEGGRIAVGRRHQKAVKRPLRHPERHQSGVTPLHNI